MIRREGGAPWYMWLVAAATLLSIAACGGTTTSAGPAGTTPTVPSSTPTLPSISPPATTSTPPGAIAASQRACGLITATDAATALGMPVGKGQPIPPVNLHNGALGGTCEWSDSAGGTVLVITLKYPSAAIASKVFKNSKSSTANVQPVRLPDMAPSEFADSGTFGGTTVAQSFLLDGNRELNVTINEPTSGAGSGLSLRAFVALVQRAARAWR